MKCRVYSILLIPMFYVRISKHKTPKHLAKEVNRENAIAKEPIMNYAKEKTSTEPLNTIPGAIREFQVSLSLHLFFPVRYFSFRGDDVALFIIWLSRRQASGCVLIEFLI